MIHGIMILTGIHRVGLSACPSVIRTWALVSPMDGRVIHHGIPISTTDIILTIPGIIRPIIMDTIHTGTVTITDITMGIITVIMMGIIRIIARFIMDPAVRLSQTGLHQQAEPLQLTDAGSAHPQQVPAGLPAVPILSTDGERSPQVLSLQVHDRPPVP